MKKYAILLITLFIFNLANSQTRESDSLALVQLYADLGGSNWEKGENWLSDMPLDDWEGINVYNDRVRTIALKYFDVVGVFPMSLLDMSELSTIEIRDGVISGPIPQGLSTLSKLDRLILSNCAIQGTLPADFSEIATLKTCVINRNQLTGSLPEELPVSLHYFGLDDNLFSGEIPNAWEGQGFTRLTMDGNMLTGNFDLLSSMEELTHFDMSDNLWDAAPFPLWTDDLPKLQWIACENCNLTGDLPQDLDFTNSTTHDRVLINDNNLSGDISLLFTGAESAEGVYLRATNNNFSGEFPIDKVISAKLIDVRGNSFSSVSNLENLAIERLDIRANNFDFTSLAPVIDYIAIDSSFFVLYQMQSDIYDVDTMFITEQTDISIDAGDDYPGVVYEWYDKFGLMPGETESNIALTVDESSQDNRYRCKMTHADYPDFDLWRSYQHVLVNIPTATTDKYEDQIKVYPNPTAEVINFSTPDHNVINWKIVDMNGRIVSKMTSERARVIDVSALASGVFVFILRTEQKIVSNRFVKR